jgi:phage-related minor tail protein
MDDVKYVIGVDDTDIVKTMLNHKKLMKEISSVEKQYKFLDKQFNKGKLSLFDYAKAVEQVDQKVAKLNGVLAGGSKAINDHATRMVQAGNKMNKFGMISQQVGYQVGDFFVQVQSGQNAMVAFAQQGTQLAGLIPGIGGAIVGVGLSVATFAYQMYNSSQGIKDADEALKDLDTSLEAIDKTLKDWVLSKKAAQAGITVEELLGTQGIEKAQKDLDDAKAKLDKLRSLSAVKSTGLYGSGTALADMAAQFFATNELTKATAEYEKALDRVRELQEKQADERRDLYVNEKRNIEQQLALQKVATEKGEKSAEYLSLQATHRKLNTEQQIKSLKLEDWQEKALIDLNNELIDGVDISTKANEELERRIKLLQGAEEAEQSAAKYSKDTVTQLNNQAAVLATSIKGKQAIAALNRQQFMFAQAGKQLSITELNAIMAAYDNLQKVTNETEDFTDEAKRTLAVLEEIADVIKNISNSLPSLELKGVVDRARLAALKGGATIEEANLAGQIAEATTKALPALGSGDGAIRAAAQQELGKQRQLLEANAALAAEIKAIQDSKKKGSEDPAIKMLEEISRRKVLIGLTEEQAKRQELVYQTEDKLGKFREKYGNDFINNIVNQTMALDEQQRVLDEARAQQEEIAGVISSSFGDAFMSIVDGTSSVKDAFRNMASYVVKELFRIIVVQQMVNALAGAITGTGAAPTSTSIPPPPPRPFANGGALYGGNVIPFAKGGVVGSPMMFPMAGGNTGLMGEAGPEAIMPLKRGKGGKLGVVAENSGNVVINQSFNFSANGDESVKKIIAQAAPQIAQMTKTSIINDRRRGGSTKAAFG